MGVGRGGGNQGRRKREQGEENGRNEIPEEIGQRNGSETWADGVALKKKKKKRTPHLRRLEEY